MQISKTTNAFLFFQITLTPASYMRDRYIILNAIYISTQQVPRYNTINTTYAFEGKSKFRTSVLVITTFLPILAFLSIMQFLQTSNIYQSGLKNERSCMQIIYIRRVDYRLRNAERHECKYFILQNLQFHALQRYRICFLCQIPVHHLV